MLPKRIMLLTAALLLGACGQGKPADGTPGDGGPPPGDGAAPSEGGTPDADGAASDGASPPDGNASPNDAPSPGDDANLPDGPSPDDAASLPDGSNPTDGGGDAEAGPRPPIDLRFEGGSVRKVHPLADGLLVLIDVPLNLNVDWGHPRRDLRAVDAAGTVRWHLASSVDRELLDFAAHPSGEMTALFASAAGFRLVRLDASGHVLADFAIVDGAVDTDPPQLPAGVVTGPIEKGTHDAGSIAALGEDAIAALRTARHSVVAYRFAFAGGTFERRYRTLAVPGYPIGAIGLTGGTYDTFGAVDSQYFVHLAISPDGTTYVGVRHPDLVADRLVKAIKDVFGEVLATDPDWTDSYVVRLLPDGTRLGTSVVGTDRPDEMFALRAVPGAVWVLGRNELWNDQGTGFDAFIGHVDGATGAATARALDVTLSDISFDLAPLPGGDVVVVGASGYSQNPHGASISEGSAAFARRVHGDGSAVAIPLPSGPRHNEARFIVPLPSGRLLVGGMLDGPGTHSADGNLPLLTAKGFVTEVTLPGP